MLPIPNLDERCLHSHIAMPYSTEGLYVTDFSYRRKCTPWWGSFASMEGIGSTCSYQWPHAFKMSTYNAMSVSLLFSQFPQVFLLACCILNNMIINSISGFSVSVAPASDWLGPLRPCWLSIYRSSWFSGSRVRTEKWPFWQIPMRCHQILGWEWPSPILC